MSKKSKFSSEEEEQLIEYVKSNEILYNAKHKKFRNSEAKSRLWLRLANEMNKEVEVIKKKWGTMRDYYVRGKTTKTTGSAATTTKRDELLSFLDQTSILKRPSVSSMPTTSTTAQNLESQLMDENSLPDDVSDLFETQSHASLADSIGHFDSSGSVTQAPSAKKRQTSQMSSDVTDILREFMTQRPKPSDFMPQKPDDDIQEFFNSMASTVRKLSPLAVARIKMKIAQIVGQEEIAWAETAARLQTSFKKSECTL